MEKHRDYRRKAISDHIKNWNGKGYHKQFQNTYDRFGEDIYNDKYLTYTISVLMYIM